MTFTDRLSKQLLNRLSVYSLNI